jgi:hypothetical protein
LLAGDVFVAETTVESEPFEMWICTKNFNRNRTGGRCQVRGVQLRPADSDACEWLLPKERLEASVLRSRIFSTLIIPRGQWGGSARLVGNGDVCFELSDDFHSKVRSTVERGINEEQVRIAEALRDPPTEEDPAITALEERHRRDRYVDSVTQNLERHQRTRAPYRSAAYLSRLEEFGFVPVVSQSARLPHVRTSTHLQ